MRKGLIVIGYQGIGKSSCAGKNGCIDLESGNFWIGEKRSILTLREREQKDDEG